MIVAESSLSASIFSCGLNRTWSSVNRELRFIARTFARLRQRHHVHLILYGDTGPVATAQSILPRSEPVIDASVAVLKRLLYPSQTNVIVDDIESLKTIPSTYQDRRQFFTSKFASHKSHRSPLASPPSTRWTTHDYASVTVDDRMPTHFSIPKVYLSAVHDIRGGVYHLPNVHAAHFYDFTQYLKTGRILQYSHNGVAHVVEAQARQLVDAIRLSVVLGCSEYENAATAELFAIGQYLEWPEDLVSSIYSATQQRPSSPARKLILAIVAAKTCGIGKRRIRQGPRDQNIDRGDRVRSHTFWKAYDEYCALHQQECAYPASLYEILQ